MLKEELISFRDYEPSDESFVYSTWLKSLFFRKKPLDDDHHWKQVYLEEIEQDTFLNNYRKVIEIIIKRSTTKIRVACLKDSPDVILAYSVCDEARPVCHWVYVKPDWRKIGLAKNLVPRETNYITHLTREAITIKRKYGLIYDPFLI